jgi:hypothetical protein
VELRIGNWTAFLAHPGLTESAVGFHHSIVMTALRDVLRRRLRRMSGRDRRNRGQASRRKSQAHCVFNNMTVTRAFWVGHMDAADGVTVPKDFF